MGYWVARSEGRVQMGNFAIAPEYLRDWAHGAPIIERELIEIVPWNEQPHITEGCCIRSRRIAVMRME
ncbi:phage protein NinX family protein [Burkholderia cepacia]|uniref:phage protein NinX family protein n=1 Tax=Burkholderia cepacia TaxID=292 RepID=UPI0023EA638F|nr:phage protein NinX family protein [Burkholderia cepacia]